MKDLIQRFRPMIFMKKLSSRLREELDYQREAQNMDLYRYMLRDEACVHLPKAYPELSSPRLLTMNWVEGQKLMAFLETIIYSEMRNQIAMNMFRVWYVPFYYFMVSSTATLI